LWKTSVEAIEAYADKSKGGAIMERERGRLALGRMFFPALLLMWAIGLFIGVDAQTSTVGSISGTLRDPTGAVVPRAQVVVQEERTGFSRTVMANDEGFYSAPSLPFGRYSVSTAPQGFKKTVSPGLDLHVNENLVVNLTLEVGPVSETVTVSNEAAPVETRSGEVSSLVSEKQVAELPLNGRNYAQLVLMVPGVSPTNDNFTTRGTGLDSVVSASVNGNGKIDVAFNIRLGAWARRSAAQAVRINLTELEAPFSDCLIAEGDTAAGHHLFDIAKAQSEAKI
jgi:hypothetical protein